MIDSELVWKYAALGVVQGLTEFLPVSSDGHLAVAEHILGIGDAETDNVAVTVALHVGTLFAVVLYLRRHIVSLLLGMFGRTAATGATSAKNPTHPVESPPGWKLAIAIVICCIPAGIAGVFLEDAVESMTESLVWSGVGFLFTALVLLATRFAKRTAPMAAMTYGHAFAIGCAQVLALAPGISRSGTTIAAGMLLGYSGPAAGLFSFLMSIPIITGAIVFKLDDILAIPESQFVPLGIGVVVSFLTGLLALWLLEQLLKRGRVSAFAWYLIPLGIVTILAA